jgi:cellulose synthase/poly-beta-1,6-N-acetylglucosamine synthase-like glycosyltransferase
MTYLFTNRFWQHARSRLGLSALLGGTGAVIRTAALLKHGWKTQSLTEDLEFTVKLILEGKRVFWNHEAVVYDEKPVSYTAALRQRQRWIQGQFWTLIRYLRPLVVALVRGDMGPGRFQCIDIIIYLMVPGQMLITYAAMLFFGVSSVAGALLLGLTVESVVFSLATLSQLAYLFVMQAIVAPSLYHGRVSLGYIRYFFHVQASIAFVLPAHLLGAANWRNQGTWVKTQHTRSIRIEERSG